MVRRGIIFRRGRVEVSCGLVQEAGVGGGAIPGWDGIQEELGCFGDGGGFQVASALAVAAVEDDAVAEMANPIGRLCAVFALESAERPIGIGDHPDAALRRADQDGVVGRSVAGGGAVFSSLKDFPRIFQELAHTAVSQAFSKIREKLRLVMSWVWSTFALVFFLYWSYNRTSC